MILLVSVRYDFTQGGITLSNTDTNPSHLARPLHESAIDISRK